MGLCVTCAWGVAQQWVPAWWWLLDPRWGPCRELTGNTHGSLPAAPLPLAGRVTNRKGPGDTREEERRGRFLGEKEFSDALAASPSEAGARPLLHQALCEAQRDLCPARESS